MKKSIIIWFSDMSFLRCKLRYEGNKRCFYILNDDEITAGMVDLNKYQLKEKHANSYMLVERGTKNEV